MDAPVFVAGCACLMCVRDLFCFMPLHGAGAGECARRRSNFLLRRQKKVTKEKATPLSASLRCASGNLRCSRPAGSRSNSLRFTALKQSRALIRWPLCSSAHTEGRGRRTAKHPIGPLLRSALGGSAGFQRGLGLFYPHRQVCYQVLLAEGAAFFREQRAGFQPVQQVQQHLAVAWGQGGEQGGLLAGQGAQGGGGVVAAFKGLQGLGQGRVSWADAVSVMVVRWCATGQGARVKPTAAKSQDECPQRR